MLTVGHFIALPGCVKLGVFNSSPEVQTPVTPLLLAIRLSGQPPALPLRLPGLPPLGLLGLAFDPVLPPGAERYRLPRLREVPRLRIPTKSAIDSDRSQPPVPMEASRGGGAV